jgi:tRNA(fMet)-specific endonuclease VapC
MAGTAQKYLPDTNILVHFVRQSLLYQGITALYPFEPTDPSPHLSVVTVGEIFSLAEQLNWGTARIQRAETFVARSLVYPLEYPGIIGAYIVLDNESRKAGRAIGDNDLWIAATARVIGATLLTTDKDFDHLHPNYIQRIYIDPNTP